MPRYQCPECESVLKRAEAVPAGKRLKCPKCAHVFEPKALPDEEKKVEKKEETFALATEPVVEKPKPAPKPSPVFEDEDGPIGLAPMSEDSPEKKKIDAEKKRVEDEEEDEGKGGYGVIAEKKEEEAPEIQYGSLRDKFAKSKVGPAMFKTVGPSNWLLRLGLFSSVSAILKAFFDIFPLIFCEAAPIRPFLRPQVTLLLYDLVVFSLGAVMCVGASRMHDLRSFPMAVIGASLSIVIYVPMAIFNGIQLVMMYGVLGIMPAVLNGSICFVGIWCLIVLFKPEVREGFHERATVKH